MSILDLLTGSGAIGDITSLISGVLDRIVPDPVQKEKLQLELKKLEQSGELAKLTADSDLAKGQLAINTEEAKSTNWFVAGWRPFIGWACGFVLVFNYIAAPIVNWVSALSGAGVIVPVLDFAVISPILYGLLGLGTMRTVEKLRNAQGNH